MAAIWENAMPHNRTTFSKFIIEDQRRRTNPDADLTALLNDIQTACKFIASAVSRGLLDRGSAGGYPGSEQGGTVHDTANDIMLRECESGGKLCGIVYEGIDKPFQIGLDYPRGRYLLVFDALDGASNLDVNVTVGTIFAVLRAPAGIEAPTAADFLQPGTQQVAAGYALYGPTSILVVTTGHGVHGFTLDREMAPIPSRVPRCESPKRRASLPSTHRTNALGAADQTLRAGMHRRPNRFARRRFQYASG